MTGILVSRTREINGSAIAGQVTQVRLVRQVSLVGCLTSPTRLT